ncbi:MAG: DUF4430 domain-containing protein [Syntrophomonadaceae bacterium]|nr:DUF4430 domain-containing protein [Syntrophomonadaceae bacterium]
MKAKWFSLILSIILMFVFISGCSDSLENKDTDKYIQADLLVTTGFGGEVLYDKSVSTNAGTVLDFLEECTEVTTSSQGKFVESINNIGGKNTPQSSWFYYINGIGALKGADDLRLNNGDKVWWDFHTWDGIPMYNAVIGSYPEPFINGDNQGENQVFILCNEEYHDIATSLKSFINNQGNNDVQVKEITNEYLANRKGPTILIGLWDDVKGLEYINQLNDAQNRGGLNFWVDNNEFHFLDAKGNIKYSIADSCGVIAAYSEGMGTNQPLWLVIGSNLQGLNNVASLLEDPNLIAGQYGVGVVSASQEIIALPVETGAR